MQGNGDQQNVQTPAVQNPSGTEDGLANGVQTNAAPALEQPTTPKWVSQLPDELKGDSRLSKYASLGEAVKGLLDGSKADSKEGGEGSQGKPAVTDYKFTKTFVEEADSDGSLAKKLAETLKSMGLQQDKAEPIYNALVDYQNSNIEAYKTKGKAMCEETLKESWGDKYDAKLASMQRAYGKLVSEDLDKGLKMTGADNNPFVAQLLAEVGESINEHTPPNTNQSNASKQQNNGFLVRDNEAYPWAR